LGDLEDFAGRVSAIREQFLAQYGISSFGPEQISPLLPSAITLPGHTRPERPTTISLPEVNEPRQSNPRSQDHRHQAILPSLYRAYGSIALPEHSSTSQISQATPLWPQSHTAASPHQITSAYHGHADASYLQTSANTYSLMSPTQWQYQPSTETSVQERRVLSPVDFITRATQSHYQQTQAITQPQFEWYENDESRWGLNQDTSQSLGTKDDVLEKFLTDDLSWIS
jgi:hypothetical protein